VAWWRAADAIEDSLLSDAVGAGGVPKLVAAVMAGAGALLLVRTLRAPKGGAPGPGGLARHARAAGLLAGCAAYVLAAPLLGYPLAIALFCGGVALYAGAASPLGAAAFGLGCSAVGWVSFVKLLAIPFPAGTLFGG
jgi:hypothetical protein